MTVPAMSRSDRVVIRPQSAAVAVSPAKITEGIHTSMAVAATATTPAMMCEGRFILCWRRWSPRIRSARPDRITRRATGSAPGRVGATLSPPALVAQGIEHRPPEPCAWVRIPPRALLDVGVDLGVCPGQRAAVLTAVDPFRPRFAGICGTTVGPRLAISTNESGHVFGGPSSYGGPAAAWGQPARPSAGCPGGRVPTSSVRRRGRPFEPRTRLHVVPAERLTVARLTRSTSAE
jgi:hypothetical protein